MKKLFIVVGILAAAATMAMAQVPCDPWEDPCPDQSEPPCFDCETGGVFAGVELTPWVKRGEPTVMPTFLIGWEGRPTGRYLTSFIGTFGFQNPAILDDWYMLNVTVMTRMPRLYQLRYGIGFETWFIYDSGQLLGSYWRNRVKFSANATLSVQIGGARVYAKAHLPLPVPTGSPYLGATLSLGAYIVLPELFPGL